MNFPFRRPASPVRQADVKIWNKRPSFLGVSPYSLPRLGQAGLRVHKASATRNDFLFTFLLVPLLPKELFAHTQNWVFFTKDPTFRVLCNRVCLFLTFLWIPSQSPFLADVPLKALSQRVSLGEVSFFSALSSAIPLFPWIL